MILNIVLVIAAVVVAVSILTTRALLHRSACRCTTCRDFDAQPRKLAALERLGGNAPVIDFIEYRSTTDNHKGGKQ